MMKHRWVVLLVVVALLAGGLVTASAAPRPTIITFESSLESITVAEAEAGETTTTLSWVTAGVSEDYRLLLHSYVLDEWRLIYTEDSVPLPASGEREVTVTSPLNFGPPTFLLSIVGQGSNTIIDQRTLTIPYADADDAAAIADFSTEVEGVNMDALAASQAQIVVAWDVENRPPTANLEFYQVFDDGTANSVELPRVNLWIPSQGEGPVAPIYRESAEMVSLRLQVVDMVDGEIYAEETLELPVVGADDEDDADMPDEGDDSGDDGDRTTPTEDPAEPQPPVESGEIVSFTAAPGTVNPGAPMTLAWEVQGTGGVTIEQSVPNMTQVEQVVSAQSPKGSAEIYLPDYAAYSVTYTLWTANRTASDTVTVGVHCPYTFFFGEADGCPSGQPFSVGVSYQNFEDGYMIWRSDTNEVYVFYDDGTAAYFLEQDYGQLDMPDLDEEMPPLDRDAPSSGFGKVWANAPGVRDKIGWALGDEQGYETTLQGVAQTRVPRPEYAFFITLPDGEVVGTGYGAWSVVQ